MYERKTKTFLSAGWNAPPEPFHCTGACIERCRDYTVHAEQRALLHHEKRPGIDMLHVQLADGKLVASGPPSCSQCSKLMLEQGIEGMWLLHPYGWHRYPLVEFHELTLEECEIPY